MPRAHAESTEAAESLVARMEAIPPGDLWAAAAADAEQAIRSARARPAEALFPTTLEPTSAAVLAEYTWLTDRLPVTDYGRALAEIHGRAIGSHPELARLLRSPEACDDIGAAARRNAATESNQESWASANARAAANALTQYKATIAEQLASSAGELAAPARALLALDDLERRVSAFKLKQQEHAANEVTIANAAREQAEAAAALESTRRIDAAKAAADAARAEVAAAERAVLRARADGLVTALKAQLARASHPSLLRLSTQRTHDDVEALIVRLPSMTATEIDFYETAVKNGTYEYSGHGRDPWRRP